MDISKHRNFLLSEIKINKPIKVAISLGGPTKGVEGYKNFIEDYGRIIDYLRPQLDHIYNNGGGLGEKLIEDILNNMEALNKKYGITFNKEYYKEWLEGYKDDIGLPKRSSGSLWTAIIDDETLFDSYTGDAIGVNEEDLYDLYDEYKTW